MLEQEIEGQQDKKHQDAIEQAGTAKHDGMAVDGTCYHPG
jgi:hypothetical protein